jgi:alcohol dehydrogenase class IV/GMP synthase-like glutamine amidotransferase
LDVGKAIAFMSGQNLPIWDFEDVGDNWTKANSDQIAPIIAVPTTAGTGSETGRASVILNEDTGVKKIIFHPKFLPSIVILDPTLTVGLPPKITAATGMDALAHNLEAYCAPGYHPMADGIALEGMSLVNKWLPEAVNNGSNLEARMNMLTAASMGSTAFQKGLGAIHSLSHPVNALNNIHHGLSNAIFMPYVLTFNKEVIEKKVIKICKYLELQDQSFNGFINWVLDLRKKLDMPHTLSEVIDEKDLQLDRLSKMALEDPSTSGNPKKLSETDMKSMYLHSMEGKIVLMSLNILVVEGNNPEDSSVFIKAAKASCSQNLKNLVQIIEPSAGVKIINPSKDNETTEALENMDQYDGIIFTGGAMRINDMTDEIKKHINFASNCFKHGKKILAICWGLQVCSTAAGGKVAPAKNGAHIGIATDVKINDEGKKNLIYKNKKDIFTTPAFNFDEVIELPEGAKLLASDSINRVMAIYFKSGQSEIWGVQYHPDYEYWQMVNLSNARKDRLLNNNIFKNEDEFEKHVKYIEEQDLDFNNRTHEVRNWLNNLKV